MDGFDGIAPNYLRAKQRWPAAPMLAHRYDALTACCGANFHGSVEHVKSFVESVCITIMGEFGVPMPSSRPKTTDLLIAALKPLGLENSRGASKIDKVLSAFNQLADALTEIRNQQGAIAHGKDVFIDAIAADHARVFVFAGDAILGVLMNALEGKEPKIEFTREPYEKFSHLNNKIDRSVILSARVDEDADVPTLVLTLAIGRDRDPFDVRAEVSRLLYGIDRSAYVDVLKSVSELQSAVEETEAEGDAETEDETAAGARVELVVKAGAVGVDVSTGDGAIAESPQGEVISTYEGRLAALRGPLDAFLRAEGLETAASGGVCLVDSILATVDENLGIDWKKREQLLSRLRVACRRVLRRFGVDGAQVADITDKLVGWLRAQVPDDDKGGAAT